MVGSPWKVFFDIGSRISKLGEQLPSPRRRVTVLFIFGLFGCFGVFKAATSHSSVNRDPEANLARLSDEVTIRVTGSTNRRINLSDGHDVITSYVGPEQLVRPLEQDQAQPLSLASADFDEDGVRDLISGYALPDGSGIITLHRGNIDSIYPNAPEAKQRKAEGTFTESPFLSPAHVFALPVAPDFIGAGDFDADGHWDVVAASRKDKALYFLLGDGAGELGNVRRIGLPGFPTAMAVGDINRQDGLADVVVGISGGNGPNVMVFEGPEGVLGSKPEVFQMPAEVNSLALGQPAGGPSTGLAVAAGRELVIIGGRDRKLSMDMSQQAAIRDATIMVSRTFAHVIRGIAIGTLSSDDASCLAVLEEDGTVSVLGPGGIGNGRQKSVQSIERHGQSLNRAGCWPHAAALYTVQVSGPRDEILLLDSTSRELELITGPYETARNSIGAFQSKPLARSAVGIQVEDVPMAVTPMRLNSDKLSDLVVLRRNHHRPAVALTVAGASFTVANTADSGAGSLRDAINQANQNPGPDIIGFNIPGTGPFVIQPLLPLPAISESVTIDGTTQPGFAGSPLVEVDGSSLPSDQAALFVSGGGSTVRGLIISGAAINVELTMGGGNVIEGNFIGTSSSGEASADGRGVGVEIIDSSSNTIGGYD